MYGLAVVLRNKKNHNQLYAHKVSENISQISSLSNQKQN